MAQQMLQISTEQLQQLVEAVRLAATSNAANGAATTAQPKSKGSFTNCNARFGGDRDREVVEEFITNATTYKEVEDISDEDALKTVSMLFYGLASTWWQAVRKEAKTWDDVIRLIREHFSPVKPYYQVYLDLFASKQEEDQAIDTFVCNKRAMLAQLPEDRHDEETEIDFIYGLMHIKYRKYITRNEVKSFKELLEKGRIIEYNYAEDRAEANARSHEEHPRRPKRCTFCNYRGHTVDQCRKKKGDANHDDN